jgi:hypothetical protein
MTGRDLIEHDNVVAVQMIDRRNIGLSTIDIPPLTKYKRKV